MLGMVHELPGRQHQYWSLGWRVTNGRKLGLCGKLKAKGEGSKPISSAGVISALNTVFGKAQL